MEISAQGDAPGANQMVEGPVVDPTTMIVYNLMDFGHSLGNFEFLWTILTLIMINVVLILFLKTAQSALMIVMTLLDILERICFIVFKCAKLILIGAAVTMGIMYACPEAKTSFWNFFGQRSNQ